MYKRQGPYAVRFRVRDTRSGYYQEQFAPTWWGAFRLIVPTISDYRVTATTVIQPAGLLGLDRTKVSASLDYSAVTPTFPRNIVVLARARITDGGLIAASIKLSWDPAPAAQGTRITVAYGDLPLDTRETVGNEYDFAIITPREGTYRCTVQHLSSVGDGPVSTRTVTLSFFGLRLDIGAATGRVVVNGPAIGVIWDHIRPPVDHIETR